MENSTELIKIFLNNQKRNSYNRLITRFLMSDKMPLLFSIIITIMKLWKAIYRYSKVVEVLVIGGGHAGC